MIDIKVLGIGCSNCKRVEQIAVKAAADLGIEFSVEKLTEPPTWKKYALMATPGLVINEKLVCAGRIPSAAEVTTWIANALEA
jgi:small redox-active disulfide protein 2